MKGDQKSGSVWFCCLLIPCVFLLMTARPSFSEVPVVSSVSPDTGTTVSTTSITITGENFEPGARVSLLSGGPLLAGSNEVSGVIHV
ncbi:MAG: hypothetical protein GXO94_08240, partial [Nitrospirae bacterium]|nr:hypothetical protein [Nitrospirota bacterium]